ncbi:MAG: hypothetical protein LAQ30_31040 [Acidobacteriia bacterium]|nr:hypothetical protein [Terriglobia bacterium]
MKTLGIAAACLALALLTFFQFPGHTWLQQDSQIYTAIMERLDDASALRHDILAAKPHVAYTLYDETTLALAFLTRFDLRTVLAVEQVAARALGIWGLYLMAMGWAGSGLPRFTRVHALCVAAVCSLGATVAGPTVLTVEYEATPRAFALPLVLCAIGLTAHGRFVAAGVAAAAAFLFHPPTALPFWILFIVVACWPGKPAIIVRRLGGMAPLAGAVVILTIFAHRQEGAGEAQAFFTRLTPFLERLQRWRASYNWISTWPPGVIGHYVILFGVLLAAFARIRREMGFELRVLLLGLPALGMLSAMPAFRDAVRAVADGRGRRARRSSQAGCGSGSVVRRGFPGDAATGLDRGLRAAPADSRGSPGGRRLAGAPGGRASRRPARRDAGGILPRSRPGPRS